jgi:hypothetical protein
MRHGIQLRPRAYRQVRAFRKILPGFYSVFTDTSEKTDNMLGGVASQYVYADAGRAAHYNQRLADAQGCAQGSQTQLSNSG